MTADSKRAARRQLDRTNHILEPCSILTFGRALALDLLDEEQMRRWRNERAIGSILRRWIDDAELDAGHGRESIHRQTLHLQILVVAGLVVERAHGEVVHDVVA